MSGDPILLVTRPEASGRRFAQAVTARVGEVRIVLSPLIEIVPLAADVPLADALVLTSAHALSGVPAGWSGPVFAVGSRTVAALRAAGLDATEAGGDAAALVRHLAKLRPAGRLLHLRGTHTRGDVVARLRDLGLDAEERVVYDQPSRPLNAEAKAVLAGSEPVVAPLFSPRTAALFRPFAVAARAPLSVLALSPAVAEALGPEKRVSVAIAERPDMAAMLGLVERRYGSTRSP